MHILSDWKISSSPPPLVILSKGSTNFLNDWINTSNPPPLTTYQKVPKHGNPLDYQL